MEVFAVDGLNRREEALELHADTTLSGLKRMCSEVLGMDGDVEVSLGGRVVTSEDTECVSSLEGLSAGCQVEVSRGVGIFVNMLHKRKLTLDSIPLWARQRRECVLAAARAHRRKAGAFGAHWVPPSLFGDAEVMLACAPHNQLLFHLASPALHSDPHFVQACVRIIGPYYLTFATDALRADKHFMLQLVQDRPECLEHVADNLRADKDVVLAALPKHPALWVHVDPVLWDDRDVSLAALPHCSGSVWLRDKAFVLEAVRLSPDILPLVSEELQQDEEVVLACPKPPLHMEAQLSNEILQGIAQYTNMKQACRKLLTKKEIGLSAVTKLPRLIQYIDSSLLDDRDVARASLPHCRGSVWLSDKAFVLEALPRFPAVFPDVCAELRHDKEVSLLAVRLNYNNYPHAARTDKATLLEALRGSPSVLRYASRELLRDKDVALAVLSHPYLRSNAVYRIDQALLDDRDVAHAALPHCRGSVWLSDKAFVLEALKHDSHVFRHVSEGLRQDKEVALAAVKSGSINFHWVGPALRDDLDVVGAAMGLDCEMYLVFSHMGDAARGHKRTVLQGLERSHPADVLLPLVSASLQGDLDVAAAAMAKNKCNYDYISPALQDHPDIKRHC